MLEDFILDGKGSCVPFLAPVDVIPDPVGIFADPYSIDFSKIAKEYAFIKE